MQNMSVEENDSSTLNILLLGEVGVGKSTFVNSFANYIRHDTFQESEELQLICPIPTTLTIVDEEYEEHTLRLGPEDFSDVEGPRDFVFKVAGLSQAVRLIDTPGVGGLNALKIDEGNIRKIKDRMRSLENVHAICFVLKPNVSVLNEHFKSCFKHLLSCIEGRAAANVIFALSHTRSTFYNPGETMSVLRTLLEEVRENPPFMDVHLSKSNVFCFDNEGFRYRATLQFGFPIDERERELFAKSWQVSAAECRRLLGHVANSTPYKVSLANNPLIDEENSKTDSVPKIEETKGRNLQQSNRNSTSVAASGRGGSSRRKKNKRMKKKRRPQLNCLSSDRASLSDEEGDSKTRTCSPGCSVM